MTKKADTWMPWYVADYLADTAHLTTEQHGAYCLMLMAAWKSEGALANDDVQLAAVCRLTSSKWRASKALLLKFFIVNGDSIVHKRVTAERVKAQTISDAKAENGKAGAKKRWDKDGKSDGKQIANAIAKPSQTDAPSPSPSHSPSESSVSKETGGEPPIDEITPKETIFHYGVPLLTNAGIAEARARSFLGGLIKGHGQDAVISKLRECFKAKPLQPLEWLAAALPPKDVPKKYEWHETQSGIEAMGIKVGVGMWSGTEQFNVYKARVLAAAKQGVPA